MPNCAGNDVFQQTVVKGCTDPNPLGGSTLCKSIEVDGTACAVKKPCQLHGPIASINGVPYYNCSSEDFIGPPEANSFIDTFDTVPCHDTTG